MTNGFYVAMVEFNGNCSKARRKTGLVKNCVTCVAGRKGRCPIGEAWAKSLSHIVGQADNGEEF